jgi:hypothetical protein
MQVLNKDSFKHLKTLLGDLYIKGNTNLTIDEISQSLDSNVFPFSLRGNFALIYLSKTVTCFAVDHYSTIPIFYTHNNVGLFYDDVKNSLHTEEENTFIQELINSYSGYSVGSETNIKNLYRVEPGKYYWNGDQHRYINLLEGKTNVLNPDTIKDLLKQSFERKLEKSGNGLLLSGGKDSSSLLGCMLNWNYDVKPVSLTSKRQPSSEKKIVKRLENEYNINVDFVDIEYSGPILTEDENKKFYGFWRENPFGAKRHALSKYNFSNVITGEAGCSVYSHKIPISYASQKQRHIKDIIKVLVLDTMSYHRIATSNINYIHNDKQKYVEFLIEHYYQLYNSFDTDDITNKILHVQTIDQSCYRLFSYSQDTKVSWQHPYTDWDFVNYIVNLPSDYKTDTRIFKLGLEGLISTIPWEYPKNGLSIPSINKYRNS